MNLSLCASQIQPDSNKEQEAEQIVDAESDEGEKARWMKELENNLPSEQEQSFALKYWELEDRQKALEHREREMKEKGEEENSETNQDGEAYDYDADKSLFSDEETNRSRKSSSSAISPFKNVAKANAIKPVTRQLLEDEKLNQFLMRKGKVEEAKIALIKQKRKKEEGNKALKVEAEGDHKRRTNQIHSLPLVPNLMKIQHMMSWRKN